MCRIMHALFTAARSRSPAIVFFDEFDYVSRVRTGEESSFDRRTKNQLLQLLGKLSKDSSVLVMGATNRPWDIDSAFLSRFQRKVFFDLPDVDGKRRMLESGLKEDRTTIGSGDFKDLADRLADVPCSGRDIDAALGRLRLAKLIQIKRSPAFAPVEGTELWAPCHPSHEHARTQPFEEWAKKDIVASPITRAELEKTLLQMKPATTMQELERYKEWAARHSGDSDDVAAIVMAEQ